MVDCRKNNAAYCSSDYYVNIQMFCSMSTILAYQKLSDNDIEGELWKDVVGYEGFYEVSNMGRVRSLDRIIPHPRIHSQHVKGRILKQKAVIDYNRLLGDEMVSLQVAFTRSGKTSHHNVRRVVYHAFVGDIDFSSDGLYVINKDGDGYNNHVSNLILVTKATKQQRSIQSGRQRFDYMKTIDRSNWKKNYSRRKAIEQYTQDDKLVKVYKSIQEAHELTGYDTKGLSNAAKGHRDGKMCGYKWRFAGQH